MPNLRLAAFNAFPDHGTLRLVAFIQADLDASEAVDPLLPEEAWSWLKDALESRRAWLKAAKG